MIKFLAMFKDKPIHTKRPKNRICKICNRKNISAEKSSDGTWHFRLKPICTNCSMLQDRFFDQINKGKRLIIKSVDQAEKVFPLFVLDITYNELIGKFYDAKTLKMKLEEYKIEYPKSEILIIDIQKHDYTEYFSFKH